MTQLNLSHFEFYPFLCLNSRQPKLIPNFLREREAYLVLRLALQSIDVEALIDRYLAIRERGLPALNITKKTPFLLGFSFVGDAYTQNEFLFKFWLKLGLKKMVRTGDALSQTKVLFDKIENWS